MKVLLWRANEVPILHPSRAPGTVWPASSAKLVTDREGVTIMKRGMLLFACLLLTLGAAPPGSAPVEIREWPVPWQDTRPRDPAVDAQGRVWFVGQTGDYIGRLDPASGKFDRFELGTDKNTIGRAKVS